MNLTSSGTTAIAAFALAGATANSADLDIAPGTTNTQTPFKSLNALISVTAYAAGGSLYGFDVVAQTRATASALYANTLSRVNTVNANGTYYIDVVDAVLDVVRLQAVRRDGAATATISGVWGYDFGTVREYTTLQCLYSYALRAAATVPITANSAAIQLSSPAQTHALWMVLTVAAVTAGNVTCDLQGSFDGTTYFNLGVSSGALSANGVYQFEAGAAGVRVLPPYVRVSMTVAAGFDGTLAIALRADGGIDIPGPSPTDNADQQIPKPSIAINRLPIGSGTGHIVDATLLASTSAGQGATLVGIFDSGNYYTTDNVNAALQQVGARIGTTTMATFTAAAAAEAGNAIVVTLATVDGAGVALARAQRFIARIYTAAMVQALVGAFTATVAGGGSAVSTNTQASVYGVTDAAGAATISVADVSGAFAGTVYLEVTPISVSGTPQPGGAIIQPLVFA